MDLHADGDDDAGLALFRGLPVAGVELKQINGGTQQPIDSFSTFFVASWNLPMPPKLRHVTGKGASEGQLL